MQQAPTGLYVFDSTSCVLYVGCKLCQTCRKSVQLEAAETECPAPSFETSCVVRPFQDMAPYVPLLMPDLRTALVDPLPEVRCRLLPSLHC